MFRPNATPTEFSQHTVENNMFSLFDLPTNKTSHVSVSIVLKNLITSPKALPNCLPKKDLDFERDPNAPNTHEVVRPMPLH